MRDNIVSCLDSQYRRLTKPIQPSEPNQYLTITTLFLIKTQKTIGDSLKTLGIVIKVGIRTKIELDSSKKTLSYNSNNYANKYQKHKKN